MIDEEVLLWLDEAIDAGLSIKEDVLPSAWYERTIITPPGNALPKISYDNSPFWRKPVDCFHPHHPARDITIMSIAQGGKTMMVINAAAAYTIAHNPQHIMYLTGATDLTKDAVGRLDEIIVACGLSHYVKSNIIKARNNRTGDTQMRKEFRGRRFVAGSITNHNMLRQNEAAIVFADDLDAGMMAKGNTGSTVDLIKGRTKAHEHRCKRGWISSPQVKGSSLIEMQYLRSDQEIWFVPCQSCHEMISLRWEIQIDEKNTAGLKWQLDNAGRVVRDSVHYVCQKCGSGFNDKNKYRFLNDGDWFAQTDTPLEYDHYGFFLHGLYTPVGMTSWFDLAVKYMQCNPVGAARNEAEYQTFVNIQLGEPYEPPGDKIPEGALEKNQQPYKIGVVPDKWGIENGCGRVVLITLAADLGGRYVGDQNKSEVDDVRLDWELKVHFENGATASINHGSIGTFRPAHMGPQEEGRELWTYDINKPHNVWREFIKIVQGAIESESGRKYRVNLTGVDTGFGEIYAFNFIDRYNAPGCRIIGTKGDKEHKPLAWGLDKGIFTDGKSRNNLYILSVGQLKDQLVARVSLKWKRGEPQPGGFMNFPERADGKYTREGYFAHFEAEHRVVDEKKHTFIWKKKNSQVQNHFMDCDLMNMALREIITRKVLADIIDDAEERRIAGWRRFCDHVLEQEGLTSALPR